MSAPDVALPPGAHAVSGWVCQFRIIWGAIQSVEGTNIELQPAASQLPDGSIDLTTENEEPSVMIDRIAADGTRCDCLRVTAQGARNLAAGLLQAADVLDGWAQ